MRGEGSRFLLRHCRSIQRRGMDADPAESPAGAHRMDNALPAFASWWPTMCLSTAISRGTAGDGWAQVTTVEDGLQAVAAVTEGDGVPIRPGTDGRGDAGDGWSTGDRNIRAAGHDLPIIGVTAHVLQAGSVTAAGMNDQLVKPIMRDALWRSSAAGWRGIIQISGTARVGIPGRRPQAVQNTV